MNNSYSSKKNERPQGQPRLNAKRNFRKLVLPACLAMTIFPFLAFGSVESSLQAVQSKLVGTLLPLAAICGLVIAGFSFTMGHANARQHLFYAVIGAIVGFGAESIIALVRGLIH